MCLQSWLEDSLRLSRLDIDCLGVPHSWWGEAEGSSGEVGLDVTSGGSRICKRGVKVERRRREDWGAEWPSAAGASIGYRRRVSPTAPRGVRFGEGCPPPQWRGHAWGRGIAPSPENFSILSLKMATFSAFWALFLQFIVHSSMDCLKRFRRQKPLLVRKHAVVCMLIAVGGKTSVLETMLWFMQRKTSLFYKWPTWQWGP